MASPARATALPRGSQAEVRANAAAVSGHRLHWLELGDPRAPAVVLLHSGLGSAREWSEQLRVLAGLGYRAIAYDRWGYGLSDGREGFAPPTFGDDVGDLQDLLDVWGEPRAVLIGLSDGGTVALELAARQPERVAGVLAAAAHAYVEDKTLLGIRELQRQYAENPAFRERLELRHGRRTAHIARDWFAGWLRDDALRWDIRPELASIQCAALIVQGTKDAFATTEHARAIADAIPGARLALLEGVGHMIPQEAPERFDRLVREFLADYPPEPGLRV